MVILRTIWFWLSFWVVTLLLFLKMFFVRLFLPKGSEKTEPCHQVACEWGQWVFKVNPGWKVTVKGRENLPALGSCTVIVANHKSAMDICALFATGIPFRWLSKDLVFKFPLMGQAMKWSGYVPVKRGNPQSHKVALDMSIGWLRKGVSMLYFPEGTRSETGELRPFKMGAFNIAASEDCSITPIVLVDTDTLMKKNSLFVAGGAHVIIDVLKPMRPFEGEDLKDFKDRVREVIQKKCFYYAKEKKNPALVPAFEN